MTITIGFWIIPLLITLFALWWAVKPFGGTDYYGVGTLFQFIEAVVLILVTWLIYFMVMYFTK